MDLEKRYFDVLAADGNYLIGYDASVYSALLPVRYRALLSSHPGFRRSAFGFGPPSAQFPFDLPFRDLVKCSSSSNHASKIEIAAGPIEWRLDEIGFEVSVKAGDAAIVGKGYSETVRLSSPPWRLGIDEIRWGRFVGNRHWAVWNVVKGATPFSLLAIDNQIDRDPVVEPDQLQGSAGQVFLGRVQSTIQDGDVLATEAPLISAVARVLAGSRFIVLQRKVVRHVRIVTRQGAEGGLAIDESVRIKAGAAG